MEKLILVKVKILIGGKGVEKFYLAVVGSKIKIVVELSVPF